MVFSLSPSCSAPPRTGSWVEHELGPGQQQVHQEHETRGPESDPLAGVGDVGKLDAAAIDRLDEGQVAAALARVGDAAPAGRLALRGARLAWHHGDDAGARALIARAASAADEKLVHAELVELGKLVAAPVAVQQKVIAVLLPLSGRFSAVGSELKTAVQVAPAEGATWLFVDTKGEPEGAVAAVESAYAKGAIAILGPAGEREGLAAARAAALRGIPIGLLAPGDGADVGAGVFRMVESPADEGRWVAKLAADENYPTVAVFAPRDDVGREEAEAFVAEAKRLGLSVNKQGSYDPTGGNLEPDVKDFLDLVPARNPRLAEHLARYGVKKGWTTFSPDVAFSLLYVPDRYDRAALVAAFLPYFGVELRTTEFPDPDALKRKHGGHMPQVVQLVGGAGWHHPTLPIRGGTAVQGALIVDAFPGELGSDEAARFAGEYQRRTGRTPSTAAAEAHDAAWLMARARREVAAGSPDPRGTMRTALAHGKLDDGACGKAAIGADGELARAPSLLQVEGDQLVIAP